MLNPTISVCIICKNEEAVISNCLESILCADEIIVVDTGSTDNTVKIAKQYTDNIYTNYKWNDDFAEARNEALKHATGDYILSIDADEKLLVLIDDIKQQLSEIEDYNALNCRLEYNENFFHNVPRIFKNGLQWAGKCHEYITCNPKASSVVIRYGKSPTHSVDPDRNLRILTKSVEESNNSDPRAMFYLAREYWDRQDYENCLKWCESYLLIGAWRYEKADAHLTCARCLFILQNGDEARDHCLQAIMLNPNFKEALNYMAELSWEKEAIVWRKFAQLATNEDVLFIRQ